MDDLLQSVDLPHLREFVGTGVITALVLLLVARILLPRAQRAKLKTPLLALGLHVAFLAIGFFLDEDSAAKKPVSLIALFLVLLSIGRSGFLLIVHSVLSRRLARPLPKIFRDIVQATIYAVALLITLRAAGVEPGSLLTTSALLTAVIGLSLQDTLGNVFAGLSLQAQQPFDVGDWIQFDENPEHSGTVLEINWRAVRVRTIEEVEVTVPNNALARAPIWNYSRPEASSRRSAFCYAPYSVPPRQVMRLVLSSIRDVPGVLTEPPPSVLPHDFDERGVQYEVRYYIRDFPRRDFIDGHVRERVWYALSRADIEMPVPQRFVHLHEATQEEVDERQRRRLEARAKYLKAVDFLDSLPEEAIGTLARMSETRLYDADEAIIRQGEDDEELFIVQRGRVAVMVTNKSEEVEVTRLGPGQFFGEMSLMTGEKRRATVRSVEESQCLVVGREAFHKIFDDRPELIARISDVLSAREEQLGQLRARASERPSSPERSAELLSKIRDFFSL